MLPFGRGSNWVLYVRNWNVKTETGQCFKCDWFLQRKCVTWCITAIRYSYFCYKSQASGRPFSTGCHAKLSWTATMGILHKNFFSLFYNMLFSPQFALTDGLHGWLLFCKKHSSLESLEGIIGNSLFLSVRKSTVWNSSQMLAYHW